jgi:hypothetical protein
MSKFKCGICGKEFDDIDQYVNHVSKCAAEHKKKEADDLQKMNDDLNRVKAAKTYYEEQLAKFKENYPDAYELNFPEKKAKFTSNVVSTGKRPEPSVDFIIDGKKIPDVSKEELDEAIKELRTDPFMRYMLKTLGLN